MENDYSDIIELARELGNIRFKLIELIQKEFEDEKYCNKTDQTFLHKIEFNEMTDEEILKIIKAEKISRNVRRNVKNRKQLIQALLDGMKIKSPLKFTMNVINAGEPFDKNIDKLKEDENLWIK